MMHGFVTKIYLVSDIIYNYMAFETSRTVSVKRTRVVLIKIGLALLHEGE